MLRGSSPIRLSQLDISPAIQAGALEQQAAANLASSVNEAVKDFTDKQEEKKQKKMTIAALEELVPGMSKEFYKAAAGNKDLQSSLIDAQVAKQKAEDQKLTQGAYYLSQFPLEQRETLARSLGLPLPPEPEILPFDIEGFETRIIGSGDKRLAEQLEVIKQNPDNPQNATALELLGMPADAIPSYLESLKAARTKELTDTSTDEVTEVVTEVPKEQTLGDVVAQEVSELPSNIAGLPVDAISALLNLVRPESTQYRTQFTPDAPIEPTLGSEQLRRLGPSLNQNILVPTLKALGFIER
tara:strand:- start:3851 stop:4747 length:897 start_codon:yes stop_codon:yes gene_type:complete